MDIDCCNLTKLESLYESKPIFSFTVDLDWASEDAIGLCCELLEKYEIPATYFITHHSKTIEQRLSASIIDAGIHPNFLADSSHGGSYSEVIKNCLELLPNAECYRCHRYFDVNDITDAFFKLGFRYDSNLCTYLHKLDPFIHRSGMLRFPVYFEDGAYLLHKGNLNFESVGKDLFSSNALMVINIHPMHLVLNSPDLSYARILKDSISRSQWNSLTHQDFKNIQHQGAGIRDFVISLLEFIKNNEFQCYTLKYLYELTKT